MKMGKKYSGMTGHDQAIRVSEYTGDEQDSESVMGDVGALDKYYYFNIPYYFDSLDTMTYDATFEFITCKITGDEGHVWMVTTLESRYRDSGKIASGGWGILSLWDIEKTGDYWQVTKVTKT